MNKLRLDLQTLEIDRADVTRDRPGRTYRIGHAATELGHSCGECGSCALPEGEEDGYHQSSYQLNSCVRRCPSRRRWVCSGLHRSADGKPGNGRKDDLVLSTGDITNGEDIASRPSIL